MVDLIQQFKSEARVLHRLAREGNPEAIRRVRLLKEFRETSDAAIAESILRRHCLAVLAREIGFDGWPHALGILTGQRSDDFGTILYPPRGAAYWNIWSASYDEAKLLREQTGGYLLAYKKHYFIAEKYFIDSLGLDSGDPDWERIGRDWVRPADIEARSRLYARLIACNPLARAA
jgi:hypothetical protein